MRTLRSRTSAALLATALLTVAACGGGGGGGGGGGDKSITVWSLENLPERITATQKIIDRFTAKTGVEVKLVGIDENQFSQLITSAGAAGKLPDVVGALSLAGLWSMASNDLVDDGANADVVDKLSEDTFAKKSLDLTRDGDKQLGVPSDGWAQLLYYRKDLFQQAGLHPPATYDDIMKAAQTLTKGGIYGITAATVPNDAFTEQTFEHLALANDCQLVDDKGTVTLDSDKCVRTFSLIGDLIPKYSLKGAQDVDSTRATYFAGKAAMVVWSSFLLDELAGLRKDALPSCAQCRKDPEFLARNTGVVTALKGPDGKEPVQFGELTSWTITSDSATDAAKQFVEFMMADGYKDWLGFAPEGKFPARKGTKAQADEFTKAWATLPAGVDTKKPLSAIYPPDVLEALQKSPDQFVRWGFPQGQGKLVGATLGELPVPKAVNALTTGQVDAAGAAKRAADEVKSIKEGLD